MKHHHSNKHLFLACALLVAGGAQAQAGKASCGLNNGQKASG